MSAKNIPDLEIELPTDDLRAVKIWFAEWRDNKLHICISVEDPNKNISARKPTVILADKEELAKIYARPGTQSQEEAIRSILKQNGQNN